MNPVDRFVVVANRDEHLPGPEVWADLMPTLESLHAFGGGRPTTLGWAGLTAPDGLPPSVEPVELPPHLSDWQARSWLAGRLPESAGSVVLVGDGVVIGPETLPMLTADVGMVADGIGLLAARSDSSTGPQFGPHNPPAAPVPVDRLEVTAAVIDLGLLRRIEAPRCDVAGDTMVVTELRRLSLQSYVSRASVHRPPLGLPALWDANGMIDRDVVERLMHFRPDLLDPMPEPRSTAPPPRAMESSDPSAALAAWIGAPPGTDRQLGLARTLGNLHRHREAVEALWEVDLDALDDDTVAMIADLLRLNGQLRAERELRASRPHRFAAEVARIDELLDLAGDRSLPPQWAAAEA